VEPADKNAGPFRQYGRHNATSPRLIQTGGLDHDRRTTSCSSLGVRHDVGIGVNVVRLAG
jgi:hypothetical protein